VVVEGEGVVVELFARRRRKCAGMRRRHPLGTTPTSLNWIKGSRLKKTRDIGATKQKGWKLRCFVSPYHLSPIASCYWSSGLWAYGCITNWGVGSLSAVSQTSGGISKRGSVVGENIRWRTKQRPTPAQTLRLINYILFNTGLLPITSTTRLHQTSPGMCSSRRPFPRAAARSLDGPGLQAKLYDLWWGTTFNRISCPIRAAWKIHFAIVAFQSEIRNPARALAPDVPRPRGPADRPEMGQKYPATLIEFLGFNAFR